MERTILHIDMNAFFAAVECAEHPELSGKPIAVAGDKQKRSGIILTASYEARKYGVKTTMTIGEAQKRCPDLTLVPPHHYLYEEYSEKVMEILRSYSSKVEAFSIDEAWIDMTGSLSLYGSGKSIADMIRKRVKEELGLTASAGVSYCKIIAKLASDMKKPDATTVILKEDIKSKVWPLPVEDMMGIGKMTKEKMQNINIFTIGDLAKTDINLIRTIFGKWGFEMHRHANGIDNSEVITDYGDPKGVGRSTTLARDVTDKSEAEQIFLALSQSVSERLKSHEMEGCTIEVNIKTFDFRSSSKQRKLSFFTDNAKEIYVETLKLFEEHWDGKTPLRLLGIRVTGLQKRSIKQITLFSSILSEKNQKIEKVVSALREKYGAEKIGRAAWSKDKK